MYYPQYKSYPLFNIFVEKYLHTMKKLILILVFVTTCCFHSFSQDLSRSELNIILTSATQEMNDDMGKNYTVADAYAAYSAGVLTITEVGVKRYRYQFLGCIGIIYIDDR